MAEDPEKDVGRGDPGAEIRLGQTPDEPDVREPSRRGLDVCERPAAADEGEADLRTAVVMIRAAAGITSAPWSGTNEP